MKKILTALACILLALSLASCSSVSKVKKAFEDEGYVWTAKEVSKEAKENGIDGVYLVKGDLLKIGIIIEFSTDDANAALKELKEGGYLTDGDITTILNTFSSTPVSYGNCCLISLSPSVIKTFQAIE